MFHSDELNKLADLHQRGVLSDEEFARAKAQLLGTGPAWAGGGAPAGAAMGAGGGSPLAAAINGLHRSRRDRWIGGVCGGIAELTGLASWLWRLLFVLTMACAGSGLLVYLLMWILIPQE